MTEKQGFRMGVQFFGLCNDLHCGLDDWGRRVQFFSLYSGLLWVTSHFFIWDVCTATTQRLHFSKYVYWISWDI